MSVRIFGSGSQEGTASNLISEVLSAIDQRVESIQDFSLSQTAMANNFIYNMMGYASISFSLPDFDYQPLITEISSTVTSLRPDAPSIEMAIVEAPENPTVEDIVIGSISGIPSFDVPILNIVLPDTPAIEDIPDIGDAPAVSDAEFPARPTYTLPSIPSLQEAQIPSPPDVTIPSFDGVMPVDNTIVPSNTFSFEEETYGSDLLNSLKTSLNNTVVNGGTGLGAAIEDAIWNREAERAALANAEAKEALADEWADRGFTLPDGVITAAMLDIDRRYQDARLTSSRDIAVKQAELAQANTHFAIQNAIQLEGALITYSSQAAQRSLEASKIALDFAISIYNAQVAKYTAQLEAYKITAVVYESRIRAAIAVVEIYKAQIEAAKLTTEYDMALIEMYKAQISGIDSLIKIYATEMETARIRAEVDKTRIEAFKARVDAYQAGVQLQVARFQMYDAAIRGEAVKAQIYETQVNAYESRVKAAQIEASVVLDRAKIEAELEKLKVDTYNSEIQAYKARIEAEATRINAIIDGYKGQVEAYKADAQVEGIVLDGQIRIFEARVKQAIQEMDIELKRSEQQLTAYVEQAKLRTECARAQGQLTAQLAASALSAYQITGGMAAHGTGAVHSSSSTTNTNSAIEQETWWHSMRES